MLKTGESDLTSLDMKVHLLVNVQPEMLEALPSPRVLVTHRHFHDLPSDFIMKRRKLVLVARDPRDVCVSLYHFILAASKSGGYSGTFDGFLSLFLQGKGMLAWALCLSLFLSLSVCLSLLRARARG